MSEARNAAIAKIIESASQTSDMENRVSQTLTYQQAYSILIRSNQIKQELRDIKKEEKRAIQRQIDICYRQRNRRR